MWGIGSHHKGMAVIHGLIFACGWYCSKVIMEYQLYYDTVVGTRGAIKRRKIFLPSTIVTSCLEAKHLCGGRYWYLRTEAECGRIELTLSSSPLF